MAVCVYGGGNQLEANFAPALLAGLEEIAVTSMSGNPATAPRLWGALRALMQSSLNATATSSIGGANVLTKSNGRNYLRTTYVPPGVESDAMEEGGCADVACDNPSREFNTCINKQIQESFCISEETMRYMPNDSRQSMLITLIDGQEVIMPRIVLTTFNAKLSGLLSRLNRRVLEQAIVAVGNNVITGSTAPYAFDVTTLFFGNTIMDSGGQELRNIQERNGIEKLVIVGDGNFANYVSSLRAARSTTNYGTDQRALNPDFDFYRDPLTETIMGPNQVLAFDDGKLQFLFQTVKGAPDWKNGPFDPYDQTTLTGRTPTGETIYAGTRIYFSLPVFQIPGLFVDVEIEWIKCVDGKVGNNGWKVTMFLEWGIFRLPSDFYSPTDERDGVTHVLALETNAA